MARTVQGYGFLSENAAFVEACAEARIKFVGPSAHAIVLFGDKTAAKELVRTASAPIFSRSFPATAQHRARPRHHR